MLSLGGQTFKKKKKPSVQHVILGPIGSANKNNYLFVKRLEEFSRHFKVEGFFNYSKHFAIGNCFKFEMKQAWSQSNKFLPL